MSFPRGEVDPIDLTTFDEVMQRQYDLQVDEDGEIWGLVAGDQGYDHTGITIQILVYNALAVAEDRGMASFRAGAADWVDHNAIQAALHKLITVCRSVVEPSLSNEEKNHDARVRQ